MSLLSMLSRTLKKGLRRGANVARRVGRVTRRTVKRGTNAVGLTGRKSRKSRK